MLSELGVKGIRIEDVFSLDESMLADLPYAALGPL